MFRQLLPLVLLLQPITLYAISCPANGNLLAVGDTMQHVIDVCGKPTAVNITDNDVLIDGELTYNKPDRPNVTFKIEKQHVTQIIIPSECDTPPCVPDKQAIIFYTRCDATITIGNNLPFVLSRCGTPTSVVTKESIPDTTKRLVYPAGAGPNVLIIYNDKLTDWENG